ncbi:MAG: 30S ribosomal protein S9 [Candidatus Enterosoma sp.]|nr:30S ribosomal protein S9 [Bacilli bacterium]MDD7607392.1 30S ribosomal protein S9 [bacterium]MDY3907281.1 30S ribosomal protein S9 [Candidatus Enterosoma sp.]MDY5650038.1 30S ribosomal protein S9 [Candidatus Enterosoma sp.]MDY5865543.1 30S ribosomal protein S9 [Candidatus Enterosoma sp.]
MAKVKNSEIIAAVGRRKSSVCRVFLKSGSGKIVVNDHELKDYFPHETLITDINQPLTVTDTVAKFDIKANCTGGGFSGQAGAMRLAIARALVKVSEDYKKVLRANGLLTVDSRVVERKKYGLRKARKDKQFSKR